jgi:hypothetical protein
MSEEELNKTRMTEDQYEATLEPEKLLKLLEKKVASYEAQQGMYRKATSAACKTLVKFCESWLDLDPLILKDENSFWFLPEASEFPTYEK